MKITVILCGFGKVGRALGRLLTERASVLKNDYNIEVTCPAVITSKGAAVAIEGLPLAELADFADSGQRPELHPEYGRLGFSVRDAVSEFPPGVLFESTLTNIETGEPGVTHFRLGIEYGWHIVSANKGPLVLYLPEFQESVKRAGVCLKYSGATAAALPTTDVGFFCLAGSTILKIEGIFTATTNLLLTRMAETGQSYTEALIEAQQLGLAETDPRLDVEGWDTANKIIILANTLMGCRLRLSDLKITGITRLDPNYVKSVKESGKAIKLLGVAEGIGDTVNAYVQPTVIDTAHPLFFATGTVKGVTFVTDTFGTITVIGGRPGPAGTAAAMLKDLINIYRH